MLRGYLARHYFDPQRLARRSLTEFAFALHTGRMIAFTGSWSTLFSRKPRYLKWKNFLIQYATEAATQLPADASIAARNAIKSARRALPTLKNTDDALATLSVIEYALEYSSDRGGEALERLRALGADLFHLHDKSSKISNAATLVHTLGIDRIITLNYDLEFEWELMTTWEDKNFYKHRRQDAFERRVKKVGQLEPLGTYDDETRSLSRTLPSGRTVISDVFWQERSDRLIEFAVGSPDQDAHILHLHGRATDPDTMVVSQRDYNKQYRRSGVARLPFEHALRMLFAGNPILFVGVGMEERNVTATLEQFISDHPNRRISPAFILWNGPTDTDLKNDLRFRWLHRFGVLTLFDDEIREMNVADLAAVDKLVRLAESIPAVAAQAEKRLIPFDWKKEDLRSIQQKLDGNPREVDIWPPLRPNDTRRFAAADVQKYVSSGSPITVCVAEPGTGKGALARAVRRAWRTSHPAGRSCIINGSFVFETDSVFSLISGLGDSRTAAEDEQSRREALQKYLAAIVSANPAPRKLLVVINGMERFLSPSGAPVSGELDALVRRVIEATIAVQAALAPVVPANPTASTISSPVPSATQGVDPPLRIFVLGTARVRRYLQALGGPAAASVMEFHDASTAPELRRPNDLGSVYLRAVTSRFAKAGLPFSDLEPAQRTLIEQKQSGDRGGIRRAVLAAYLSPETLNKAGATAPDLCLEILTMMAFIGQPVEDAVLAHGRRVQKRLPDLNSRDETDRAAASAQFAQAVGKLVELGLIIRVSSFEGTPPHWKRYGLHRAVLAELRDRHGVPLSDSQLSSAFNLSIFSAQPADGYSPEGDIHQELGELADWLIGAYKDPPHGPEADIEDVGPGTRWKDLGVRNTIRSAVVKASRARPHVSSSLRAALALMRGYYSTSALLTLDMTEAGVASDIDGPLTEHGDRIERLLAAAGANTIQRRALRKRLNSVGADAWIGPAPFYADDLVWLQNELGVVKLAQGDLYGARRAFEEAMRLNCEHVEFNDRGQNWRRITMNQVHVDVERGALDRAEHRMDQIEESLSKQCCLTAQEIRAAIIGRYLSPSAQEVDVVHPDIAHDVVLTTALIFGYRGLCLHLRGHLKSAQTSFELCTSILQKIGELRAYAMFQRHHASLLAVTMKAGVAEVLRLSIASAEATRQTDLAYLARISQAQHSFPTADAAQRPVLLRLLQGALLYAEAGDMHRVRVEAGLNLATIKQAGGDFDAALEHATDAMATATRYGLSLRKISLRILIGQILVNRGDPRSGRALLEKAIRNADRVNYQRAVETAQNVLIKEGR